MSRGGITREKLVRFVLFFFFVYLFSRIAIGFFYNP